MSITRERIIGLKNGEKWVAINGFPGYWIGEYGDVISQWRNRFYKVLKGGLDSSGYRMYRIKGEQGERSFKAHRLVATHFGVGSEADMFNHIDGNKLNNHFSNLEITNPRDNQIHAYKLGLKTSKGENHPSRKLSFKEVGQIRLLSEFGLVAPQIAKVFEVSPSCVNDALTRSWQGSEFDLAKRPLDDVPRNKKALAEFKKECGL